MDVKISALKRELKWLDKKHKEDVSELLEKIKELEKRPKLDPRLTELLDYIEITKDYPENPIKYKEIK